MIELGVFSLTDVSGTATASDRVRDIVDYGVRADELGLDVFGVGEHHTPRFAVPSPAVVLAGIASRTTGITLTSAVSVLSTLDPVRLYQDFAQLDLVSNGRAEITAGRSAYAEPFAIFGVPLDRYDEAFEEKLGLLLAVRAESPVTWSGQFRTPLVDAPMIPRLDRPLPVRLGVGGSAGSAVRAARLGLPMTLAVLIGRPADQKPVADLYWETAEKHGLPSGQLSVGVAGHLFVGDTSQGARETFYPHYRSYFADGRGVALGRTAFDAMAVPEGALLVGSSQEIIDKIMAQRELFALDRVMGQVDIGGLPRELVVESMERFATEVAPVVRREAA